MLNKQLGFGDITLESVALVRPVDPADTALVDEVCHAADDLADQSGKLRGRRLAEAVEALNALGGTWQRIPGPAADDRVTRLSGRSRPPQVVARR